MKKFLLLLTLGVVVFVVVFRQRLFLRDPIASVARDGVTVKDASVMINFTNDVLLDDGSAASDGKDGRHRIYIVQNWNRVAAGPAAPLKCVQGVACLTDADQATATPVVVGSRGRRAAFEGVTMTNKRVEFVDEDGALVLVTLR